jgi:hypothetical protein
LYDPVVWRVSILSVTSAPVTAESARENEAGVRCMPEAMRWAAARTESDEMFRVAMCLNFTTAIAGTGAAAGSGLRWLDKFVTLRLTSQ